MAKVVKLPIDVMREWRKNVLLVLGDDGQPIREVTERETTALFELQRKAERTGRTQKAELRKDGAVQSRLAVEPVQIADETTQFKFLVDGSETIPNREAIKRRMLAQHGECQLRRPTGQFLCSLRDPTQKRPSLKDSQSIAPNPEHCQCKDWFGRERGRHHKICSQNQYAPIEQKALEAGGTPDSESIEMIEAPEPPRQRPQGGVMPPVNISGPKFEPPRMDDPEPKKAYRARPKLGEGDELVFTSDGESPPGIEKLAPPPASGVVTEADGEAPDPDPMVLVNLKGAPVIVREASPDEIEEAEANFEERQIAAITRGSAEYQVLPRSEASRLLR